MCVGDGRTVRVTVNLADALRRLRNQKTTRLLWVDALCINQKDTKERAAQVKVMGLIYWKAHRVQVWLGEDVESSEAHSAQQAIDIIKTGGRIYNKRFECSFRELLQHSESISEQLADFARPERKALARLLDQPWFQRVWCVQELGLARAATFNWGNSQFTIEELRDFLRLLRTSDSGLLIHEEINCQMFELAEQYWNSTRGIGRTELGSNPDEAESFFDILSNARGHCLIKYAGQGQTKKLTYQDQLSVEICRSLRV